jgi:mono/diheme cytochrome c family protein
MNKSAWLFAGLMAAGPALAAEVDYHTDIRPIMEKYCVGCHGPSSPNYGEFMEHKEKFTKANKGPRMDGYETLIFYIAWPDTGALMRRLDDGKHTKDGKPGNMYERLGNSDEERQKNLALIKAWVGEDAWILKRKGDITKEELLKIKAKY